MKIDARGKSIFEVLAFYIVFGVLVRWLSFYLRGLEVSALWRNSANALVNVLAPLGMVLITKTGGAFRDWRRGIHIGVLVFGIGILQSAGFSVASMLGGRNFNSPSAFLVLVVTVLTMIATALWIFRRVDDSRSVSIGWKAAFLGLLLFLPGIVAIFVRRPLLTVLGWESYFLVSSGFGEEIMYRGYIQTRINQAFGRPWRFSGVQFGPGLWISSILFGFSHLIQLGSMASHWPLAISAIGAGLFFGLIREKGSVWSSIIFHGWWGAVPGSIMTLFGAP
jgi:membrane protease YdiL (CAAX protease family)